MKEECNALATHGTYFDHVNLVLETGAASFQARRHIIGMWDGQLNQVFESVGTGFTLQCEFGTLAAAYGKRKGTSAVMAELIPFETMANIFKHIIERKPHITPVVSRHLG